MAISRAKARAALAKPERFLYLTKGTEACYQIEGEGVVPRKLAEEMTGLFPGLPTHRKGEQPLIPQEDGLFPGMSQTWRMGE